MSLIQPTKKLKINISSWDWVFSPHIEPYVRKKPSTLRDNMSDSIGFIVEPSCSALLQVRNKD
jgi:hypothetical protein